MPAGKVMGYEGNSDTNHSSNSANNLKKTGGAGNLNKNWDCPDNSTAEIS